KQTMKKKVIKMTWEILLKEEIKKPYFQELITFLKEAEKTQTIFPQKEDRLACFKLTPLKDVKVVILGQDPYHGPNQAHGLSFSVKTKPLPPSLQNIYKELYDDLGLIPSESGNLTPWAKQGVLLLNTILTVEAHKPLSHKNKGWEIFTLEVIKLLNQLDQPIVFILWGSHAQSFKKYLSNKNHLIIESPHPSPLSSYRGFFGSKPFSNTNDFLINHNVKPIDWEIK